MVVVNSIELQNNFGKYLELTGDEEIVITENGVPLARLLGIKKTASFLSDQLVGIIPKDINVESLKAERLDRQ
jgi:prevent-host-death family protein